MTWLEIRKDAAGNKTVVKHKGSKPSDLPSLPSLTSNKHGKAKFSSANVQKRHVYKEPDRHSTYEIRSVRPHSKGSIYSRPTSSSTFHDLTRQGEDVKNHHAYAFRDATGNMQHSQQDERPQVFA
jgi:hypothetical protein